MRSHKFQRNVDYIFGLPVALICFGIMRFILGYRFENVKEFREYAKKNIIGDSRPLLICSNHMTYIDSGFIIWAFSNPILFYFRYKWFSWNTPAADYQKNLFFRFIVYFNKGIFIKRGSGSHVVEIIKTARSLIEDGEIVTIFPEGTRTKTGYFQKERLKLGVGRIIEPMKECRVLCMHIRGDKQRKSSGFPPLFSKFRLQWCLLTFEKPRGQTPNAVAEKARCVEIVTKIGETIANLEKNYLNINNFTGNSDTLR